MRNDDPYYRYRISKRNGQWRVDRYVWVNLADYWMFDRSFWFEHWDRARRYVWNALYLRFGFSNG